MEIHPDFNDLLHAFSNEGVRYLVVGGYAVNVHGRPRATKDLDIWIAADTENAQRVYRALHQFGAPLEGATAEDFAKLDRIYQMGVPPVRVDILTSLDGITFEEAWADRLQVRLGTTVVTVIGRDALVKNKRAVGRKRDLADIEDLVQAEE